MKIKERLYKEMESSVRARAIIAACGRQDFDETERLLSVAQGNDPARQKSLRAMETYAMVVLNAMKCSQETLAAYLAVSGFCLGWLKAGGSPMDTEYLTQRNLDKLLCEMYKRKDRELNSVLLAAFEWCTREGIDPDAIANALGMSLRVPVAKPGPVDDENLAVARGFFANIKLS